MWFIAGLLVLQAAGGSGTGFHVHAPGIVATNHHVVAGHSALLLVRGGLACQAQVVLVDEAHDLALLDADESCSVLGLGPPLAFGPEARMGERSWTVGYPFGGVELGVTPIASEGMVKGVTGFRGDPTELTISNAIHPGHSGGAVVGQHGYLLGVASSYANPAYFLDNHRSGSSDLNFAIKAEHLRALAERLGPSTGDTALVGEAPADLLADLERRTVLVLASDSAPIAEPPDRAPSDSALAGLDLGSPLPADRRWVWRDRWAQTPYTLLGHDGTLAVRLCDGLVSEVMWMMTVLGVDDHAALRLSREMPEVWSLDGAKKKAGRFRADLITAREQAGWTTEYVSPLPKQFVDLTSPTGVVHQLMLAHDQPEPRPRGIKQFDRYLVAVKLGPQDCPTP